MSHGKQTARKTTGKHVEFTLLSQSASVSTSRPAKRVRHAPLTDSISLSDVIELDSEPSPLSSPSRPTSGASTNDTTLASGTATKQRPLDVPISVCTQFATWLETQNYVHDDMLLQAVERDGSQLLSLAKVTIMFDNALRGNVPSPVDGVGSPLSEHAQTLRIFSELLKSKISDGTLSKELERAVLRDGEALLRLALCCLDFDRAIQRSGVAS